MKTLFVAAIWVLLGFIVLVLYLLRELSPMREFVAWVLAMQQILWSIGGIAVAVSVWVVKHDFGSKKNREATPSPKLEILDIQDDKPFWETEKRIGQESFWLRLGVRNSGKSNATQCGGKIVRFIDSNNKQIGRDLIPLCWQATYVGQSLFETELRPGETKYLDVLVQKEESPTAAYFAAPLTGRIDLLEQVPDNIVRLVIAVYCKETQSVETEFVIKWNDATHRYQSLRLKESTSDKEDSRR